MQDSNKILYLIAGTTLAALITLAVLGYFYVIDENKETTTGENLGIEFEGEGNPIINMIPAEEVSIMELMPDLAGQVEYSNALPAEARSILGERISGLTSYLSENPEDMNAWLNLGLEYHSAGDYRKAADVWEFLIQIVPGDTTAYDNLGKLYHLYLKDFPKAEIYFRKSIEINPKLQTPYVELFSLYKYSYKQDTTRAADILQDLSHEFPQDPAPLYWLGAYYKEKGKVSEAKAALTEALDLAREQENVEYLGIIGDELASLPE